MPISRELALQILKYLIDNPSFNFPFLVMCRGYASYTDDDNDFVEIVPADDYENLLETPHYDEFELRENLKELNTETIRLMSKGFIERIVGDSLENRLEELAKEYRANWNADGWEIEDSEKFKFNEFIGGKAEGLEESRNIVREFLGKKPLVLSEWYENSKRQKH